MKRVSLEIGLSVPQAAMSQKTELDEVVSGVAHATKPKKAPVGAGSGLTVPLNSARRTQRRRPLAAPGANGDDVQEPKFVDSEPTGTTLLLDRPQFPVDDMLDAGPQLHQTDHSCVAQHFRVVIYGIGNFFRISPLSH